MGYVNSQEGSRFARVLSNDLYECKSKGSFNNGWLMSLGSLEVSDCPVSPLCSERLDRLEENGMGNGPENSFNKALSRANQW